MATKTSNYEFIKPELTDVADITATNENWDKIDEQLNDITEDLANCLPKDGTASNSDTLDGAHLSDIQGWVDENYLSSNTGTITGALHFKKVENGSSRIHKNHSATVDYGLTLYDESAAGKMAMIRLKAATNTVEFIDNNEYSRTILHTGNSAKVVVSATDVGEGASVSYDNGTIIFCKG